MFHLGDFFRRWGEGNKIRFLLFMTYFLAWLGVAGGRDGEEGRGWEKGRELPFCLFLLPSPFPFTPAAHVIYFLEYLITLCDIPTPNPLVSLIYRLLLRFPVNHTYQNQYSLRMPAHELLYGVEAIPWFATFLQ